MYSLSILPETRTRLALLKMGAVGQPAAERFAATGHTEATW